MRGHLRTAVILSAFAIAGIRPANAIVAITPPVTGSGTPTDPYVASQDSTPSFPISSFFDIFVEVHVSPGLGNTDTIVERAAPYEFPSAVTMKWYDPPIVGGFEYVISSGAFISVQTPTGFGPVDVFVGGVDLATIPDGGTFTFDPASQPSDFILFGLNPPVDAGNTNAYLVLLNFTAQSPTLAIIPLESIPEPTSLAVLAGGLLGLRLVRRRRP